jgi:MFS family permease
MRSSDSGTDNGGAPWPVLRALRHRNFRLFFAGQGISLIGTWLTRVATSWLVYRLTDSKFLLGLVGFTGQIPILLLAPFAGVLIDRWDRRRLLIVTQSLFMLQSLTLAALALSGVIRVWHIIVLSLCQGLAYSFDTPGRQSFVVEMLEDRNDLSNAIALNSSMFNSARLIGPAIAGILIARVGEGLCFLCDGISYIAVIGSLLAMRVAPGRAPKCQDDVLQGMKEGLGYALGFAPIRSILLLLATVSLMGMPYSVLLPVFATKVLHGNADTLGFLTSAAGLGALAGAIYMATRKTVLGLGRWIAVASALFGVGLAAFAVSHQLWLSMAVLMLAGFGLMVQMASCNTVLQTIVEDDKRGRVMGLYTVSFLGIAPFGSLAAGGLASLIGASYTVLIGGVCCIGGSLMFARRLPMIRRLVRPIYIEKGIIPPVASAIRVASEPPA